MYPWKLPVQRWPLAFHALLAGLCVAAVGAAGQWWLHSSHEALSARQTELQALQTQLSALRGGTARPVSSDISKSLASASRSEDVVHEIGRTAQQLGIHIASLSVESRPATASELGAVNFNVAAYADYRTAKAWMAQLLGRFRSLGIRSVSLRDIPNDASRLDVNLALVLVVKD